MKFSSCPKPVVIAAILLALFASPGALGQAKPIPLIDYPLVPQSTAPGSPGLTLTVNGAGFVSDSSVKWNGQALATTYVSSAQLTALIPSAKVSSAGTAAIT